MIPGGAGRLAIALTMGDPAGIGPELCLRAMEDPAVLACGIPTVIGDADILRRVAGRCGLDGAFRTVSPADWEAGPPPDRAVVVDCRAVQAETVVPGRVAASCGRAAYHYIRTAVTAALAGRVAAVITAPIHKQALRLAGVPEPGHTEILARLTRSAGVCMMLYSEPIAVSLVTVHLAYEEVPQQLTPQRIGEVINLTVRALVGLGRPHPSLVVCGLNPHAGEEGLFGTAEREIIAPAVDAARARGLRVEGPVPPDTAFIPARRRTTDAFIAMYHDQGLIPFKMLAFDRGVNVTLGLPIVRTSPDHGTAFDIAWQGKASADSMIESVRLAARLSRTPEPPGGQTSSG